MKRVFSVAMVPLIVAAVHAQDYAWITNAGTIVITAYIGVGGDVMIPETITGLPVTTIGSSAFEKCPATSVTIPDGVKHIERLAFWGCTNLTRIAIPKSVIMIGDWAFRACTSLTNATIGDGVISIGASPFGLCTRLGAIRVNALNPSYCDLDGVLFDQSQTILVQYPGGRGGEYTIPIGVRNIAPGAFTACIGLTNIAIPKGVLSIGNGSFEYCGGLTTVTIPKSVHTIGDAAFGFCLNLTGIFFAGDAPVLGGSSVFYYTSNATVHHLPGTTGWAATYGECPTALWELPFPVILDFGPSFGPNANGFGFMVSWATNLALSIEGSTNPAETIHWSPITTHALTNGCFYFADPDWTSHPVRYYRVRWP